MNTTKGAYISVIYDPLRVQLTHDDHVSRIAENIFELTKKKDLEK